MFYWHILCLKFYTITKLVTGQLCEQDVVVVLCFTIIAFYIIIYAGIKFYIKKKKEKSNILK